MVAACLLNYFDHRYGEYGAGYRDFRSHYQIWWVAEVAI